MDETLFPKAYDPKTCEDKWYAFWESQGFFTADPTSSKPAYCIVIPPPNVTGVLHMGHALVDTLQDVLIRWKRMLGFEVLWVPGTDHAGIATQTVVERQLIASTGKRRKEFFREEFLDHVWSWKNKSETQILSQLKKLGCSCDWSRLAFTMDAQRNLAVTSAFKKLFDANLIYRGDYLVHWDPVTQTALADDEVEYEEQEGFLWYFSYPLEKAEGSIVVATTRPETMLGDTAVAVSFGDPRYEGWIGKRVVQPLMNRSIPIIADRAVDPAFGTGAVKITPAHDHTDYAIGLAHGLPMINLLTPDGRMNENAGAFAGLSKEEARSAVIEAMKEKGLLVKIEKHKLRVGISYRSKAVIEPYLSKQWFVRMEQFKPLLREVVETKKVRLIPPHWESTYFHWIDHLRDWCISRQLWWGHRIPIWYRKDNPTEMLCSGTLQPPPEVASNPDAYVQDEDVLDTWFSSALWPFSTLGWPHQTPELNKFYPNSTLITGHDILFFWVARMILMGEIALEHPPFPETFLHGLIYGKSYWRMTKEGSAAYVSSQEKAAFDIGKPLPSDVHSKWEKMSKSKGNIIDPLEMIAIYGADAMRMGLCASATHARQIDLDRRRFEEFKNFANKLWNGARFVFLNIETLSQETLSQGLDETTLKLEDRWILSLLDRTIEETNRHLADYAFDKAATVAYDFFWKEFCAYYVELVKPVLFGKTGDPKELQTKQILLCIVLMSSLRLMHPMAPFVTEELFAKFKAQFPTVREKQNIDPYTRDLLKALASKACIVAPYPLSSRPRALAIEETFAFVDEVVHALRHIRAEMQLPPGTATDLYVVAPPGDRAAELIRDHSGIVYALVKLRSIHFVEQDPQTAFSASALVASLKLVIPLPEELKEKEKIRLTKDKDKYIQEQNRLRTQLSNADFVERAPAELVDKLRLSLIQAEKELAETLVKLSLL
jgi:valyl-tRNA synthetase